MPSKVSGNPQQSSVEVPTENPSVLTKQKLSNDGAETGATELEEVEGGLALVKPSEVDKEVSSPLRREMQGEAAGVATLEESGFDSSFVEEAPLDALFASYTELLPQARELQEVIIGVDNRIRINNTTIYPWSAICALKITAQDNSRWIGTGWLISPRTVITAGHCVYMHDHGGWAKSIEVIPGLNDASRPFGSCTGTSFKSVLGWTQNKDRNYDYGAIILPQNCRPGARTGVNFMVEFCAEEDDC